MLLEALQMIFPPFLLALGVTAALVPSVIIFTTRLGIVDKPDGRRIHQTTTPRGGGIALYIGTQLGCALLFALPTFFPQSETITTQWWTRFVIGSFMIAIVGLIDDATQLKPYFKLAGQTCAALIMVFAGTRIGMIFGTDLPPTLDILCTVAWFLFVTNIFNLIDGLDGLATGLAAISSLGLAGTLVYRDLPFEALLCVAFIGACIGFLRFNLHPARIFLGDTGSNFIGFFLAALTVETGSKGSTVAYIAVPLLALGIPILDTLLAIWRRSARVALAFLLSEVPSRGLMSADLEHLHHRLVKLGISHRNVVAFLYLANANLVLIGLLTLPYQKQAFTIILSTLFLGCLILLRYVPLIELWDTGLAVIHGLARPTRPGVTLAAYSLLDLIALVATLFAVVEVDSTLYFQGWLHASLHWCFAPFVSLLLAEIISRRQSLHGVFRLRVLTVALALSGVLNFLYSWTVEQGETQTLLRQALLYFALSNAFVITTRTVPEVVREIMERRGLLNWVPNSAKS